MEYITPIPQEIELQVIKQEIIAKNGFDTEMDVRQYDDKDVSTYVVSNTASKFKNEPLNFANIPIKIKTEYKTEDEIDKKFEEFIDIPQSTPYNNSPDELFNDEFEIKNEAVDQSDDQFTHVNVQNKTFKVFNRGKYWSENLSQPFECKFCKKLFLRNEVLMRHIAKNHVGKQDQTYRCGYCHQTYSSKSNLHDHKQTQCKKVERINLRKTKSKWECSLCQMRFTKKYDLQLHVAKVHMMENTILTCDICNKSFFTEKGFHNHQSKAHLNSPFKYRF